MTTNKEQMKTFVFTHKDNEQIELRVKASTEIEAWMVIGGWVTYALYESPRDVWDLREVLE